MKNIAVFVSGNGSNLQSVIDNIKNGYINAKISCVVSNKRNAYAIERAKREGIETIYASIKEFNQSIEYEKYLVNELKIRNVDLIILAGFLYIFSPYFINTYRNKIINIHPSLLPAFGGKGMYGINVHKKVIEYGAKISGATVHFVNEEPDGGPIILQKSIFVYENDTPTTLQERILKQIEWKILPLAVKLICEDLVKVEGRKVIILDKSILKEVGIEYE